VIFEIENEKSTYRLLMLCFWLGFVFMLLRPRYIPAQFVPHALMQ